MTRNCSEILLNCETKIWPEQECNSECNYYNDSAFGITIIPGSGKLIECPKDKNDDENIDNGNNFIDCIRNKDICPKAYPVNSNLCLSDCTDFSASAQINFVNGNIIINDSLQQPRHHTGISQCLSISVNDAIDIFPNLLGVNGSIYIINTQYTKITGFDKLRFVTGSIVIVNNPNLVIVPTFPSLLNVGGQVVSERENSHDHEHNILRCEQSSIIIANNPSLRRVTGFEAVRQVKDGIFIIDNFCLQNICGFIHLYRTDRLVIKGNSRLQKIVGFCYIDTVNIGLYIFDNNIEGEFDLTVGAFVTLETAGRIVVVGNKSLKIFKLDALRIVVNEFIVRSNDNLEELSSSVYFVSNLFIENNKSLHTIKFPNLEEINQSLHISGNCSLLCLNTFEELNRVSNGIIIADNKQLTELKGFNKLKYIGSNCVNVPEVQVPTPCNGCGCFADIRFDWSSIKRHECHVFILFPLDTFDKSRYACAYKLPEDFFRLLCNSNDCCDELNHDRHNLTCVPNVVNYSLIIFRNQRLRAIGGFCNLKHVNSNIYIIYNSILHTINAFGQLAFAIDIWIRNNCSLKFIIGFGNLLSVRDFVVYESVCLCDLNNIKSLEFAQNIAIEARNVKSVKCPRSPIPSVLGYALYYSYDNKC